MAEGVPGSGGAWFCYEGRVVAVTEGLEFQGLNDFVLRWKLDS